MPSVALPFNIRSRVSWNPGPKKAGCFAPYGELSFTEDSLKTRFNPGNLYGTEFSPLWSARIFVGFNVGDIPTYTMEQVVGLVKTIRASQDQEADSSFIYQRGLYTHRSDGKVVEEQSAQIVFINVNTVKEPPNEFRLNMLRLGDTLRETLKQESVIVTFYFGSDQKETVGLEAEGIPVEQILKEVR